MESVSKADQSQLENFRKESQESSAENDKLRKTLTESDEKLCTFYTQTLEIFNERLVNWEKHVLHNLQALLKLMHKVEEERVRLRAENFRLKNQFQEADSELKVDSESIKKRKKENERLRIGQNEQDAKLFEAKMKTSEALEKTDSMEKDYRNSLEKLDRKKAEMEELQMRLSEMDRKYQVACKMIAQLNSKVMGIYREVLSQKADIPEENVEFYFKLPRNVNDDGENAAQELLSSSRTTSAHQSTGRTESVKSQPKSSPRRGETQITETEENETGHEISSLSSKRSSQSKTVPFLQSFTCPSSEGEFKQVR